MKNIKSFDANEKKRDEILKLDVNNLEKYIHQLTKGYYSSYINDDKESFKRICNDINETISNLIEIYPNIYNYFLYSFLESSNLFLKEMFDRDAHLLKPLNVILDLESDNPIDEGVHDLTQEDYLELAREQYELQRKGERTLEGYDEDDFNDFNNSENDR